MKSLANNQTKHYEFDLEPTNYAKKEFLGWIKLTNHEDIEDDIFISVDTENNEAYITNLNDEIKLSLTKNQQQYWLEYATELFESRFQQEIEQAEQERKAERREWLKMARTCSTRELETI